jgi:hypothetical protein
VYPDPIDTHFFGGWIRIQVGEKEPVNKKSKVMYRFEFWMFFFEG